MKVLSTFTLSRQQTFDKVKHFYEIDKSRTSREGRQTRDAHKVNKRNKRRQTNKQGWDEKTRMEKDIDTGGQTEKIQERQKGSRSRKKNKQNKCLKGLKVGWLIGRLLYLEESSSIEKRQTGPKKFGAKFFPAKSCKRRNLNAFGDQNE